MRKDNIDPPATNERAILWYFGLFNLLQTKQDSKAPSNEGFLWLTSNYKKKSRTEYEPV